MPKFTIESEKLQGFAMEAGQPGDTIGILDKSPIPLTSDTPGFHFIITKIANIFISKTTMLPEETNRFLIIHHDHDKADIYIKEMMPHLFAKLAHIKSVLDRELN